MGDDAEPHDRVFRVPDAETLQPIMTTVLRTYELPRIDGGRATWCLTSRRPIAVIAQQWSSPQMVSWRPLPISACKMVNGMLRFHFIYFAQLDPAVVLEVLRRLATSIVDPQIRLATRRT